MAVQPPVTGPARQRCVVRLPAASDTMSMGEVRRAISSDVVARFLTLRGEAVHCCLDCPSVRDATIYERRLALLDLSFDPTDDDPVACLVDDVDAAGTLGAADVYRNGSAMEVAEPELQALVDTFGSDALRMALVFPAPPAQPFEFSVQTAASALRWLQRLAVMAKNGAGTPPTVYGRLSPAARAMRRAVYHAVQKVEGDYHRLALNAAAAGGVFLAGEIGKFRAHSPDDRPVLQDALRTALLILSPVVPALCRDHWQRLTGDSLDAAVWPVPDDTVLEIEIAVQVDGRLRGRLAVNRDERAETVLALARRIDNVARWLAGRQVKRVVHVPGKLVNFVVS